MDVMAHGLWGGALFYAQGRKEFFAGVLLGIAPDLLSFGVFHVPRVAHRAFGGKSLGAAGADATAAVRVSRLQRYS